MTRLETSVHVTVSNRRSTGSARSEFFFLGHVLVYWTRLIVITFYFSSNLQAIFEGMDVFFVECILHTHVQMHTCMMKMVGCTK